MDKHERKRAKIFFSGADHHFPPTLISTAPPTPRTDTWYSTLFIVQLNASALSQKQQHHPFIPPEKRPFSTVELIIPCSNPMTSSSSNSGSLRFQETQLAFHLANTQTTTSNSFTHNNIWHSRFLHNNSFTISFLRHIP